MTDHNNHIHAVPDIEQQSPLSVALGVLSNETAIRDRAVSDLADADASVDEAVHKVLALFHEDRE